MSRRAALFGLALLLLALVLGACRPSVEETVTQITEEQAGADQAPTVVIPSPVIDIATETSIPKPSPVPTDAPVAEPATPAPTATEEPASTPFAVAAIEGGRAGAASMASGVRFTVPTIVNVRSGPGTNYAVLGQMTPGQSFDVVAANPVRDWLEIEYNGEVGWVAARVVNIAGDLNLLAVSQHLPPAMSAAVLASPAPLPTVQMPAATPASAPVVQLEQTPATPIVPSTDPHPLQIEVMRQQIYPGSAITFEQTLEPGVNYSRYIVSYLSEGYKIYALMTIPGGERPATGWPVIIFNHGYIPPAQYRTTERYVAYADAFARNGYIVFKSDYRGHGSSEGEATGGYGSPAYTNDVLNALASVKAYPDADPNRIGMWGHSMGGQLTLRSMVVSKDIRAGVIWAGVVAPYPDIFNRGTDPLRPTSTPSVRPEDQRRRRWRQELTEKYGTPEQNPQFWASIAPNSYLVDLSGPIQLHHSTTDEDVPVESSQKLYEQMQAVGMPVELYIYPGDNHNINGNFGIAMQRSLAFFDHYVKGQ